MSDFESNTHAAADNSANANTSANADTSASVPSNDPEEIPMEDPRIIDVYLGDAPEDDEDYFAEDEAAEIPAVDPATVVTIRTSQGADVYVEAPEPMPLVDAVAKCGVRFNGDYTCWLNGQEVSLGTLVSGGQIVTVIGSVKGGKR